MAILAILGHETRGREVIEILEILGCKPTWLRNANSSKHYYYINSANKLDAIFIGDRFSDKYITFTLEEFLEKFPYKIGDKVKNVYGECVKVYEMKWIDDEIQYRLNYGHHISGWYRADELQPYKEETMDDPKKVMFEANAQCCDIMNHLIKEEIMEENLEQITLDIPDGYEFFGINDDNKVVLTKKHIQYPKNYEECCKVLNLNNILLLTYNDFTLETPYDDNLLILLGMFRQLKICRDAYWKIAGEEMGLGKPWEPDFLEGVVNTYYTIHLFNNKLFLAGTSHRNAILSFPTAEMRDAFYGNFKSLIEKCKELL